MGDSLGMGTVHRRNAKRQLAFGLLALVTSATVFGENDLYIGSLPQAQRFGPAKQCELRFEDLWNCEAGKWEVADKDTLFRALVQVQQEIPGSAKAIERRINRLCNADVLSREISGVVMSSGTQSQPVLCYIAVASLEEVERFKTGAKTREIAHKSGDACRKFYREYFFAELLKAYHEGETDPVRAACGEAFAAQRVGIYPKDSPEAVVVRQMMLLSGDNCHLNCYREMMGLYSQRYLNVHKEVWVATFDREAAQGKKDSLRRLFGRWMSLDMVRRLPPLEFMAKLQLGVHENVERGNRFSRVNIVAREQDTADKVVLRVRYSGLPDIPKYEEIDYVHLVREEEQWRIDR